VLINKHVHWVFDLDDTLYKEADYRMSGFKHVVETVNSLYKSNLSLDFQELLVSGKDVLEEICVQLSLPESSKQSLLWLYRLHYPNIKLSSQTKAFMLNLEPLVHGISILTDGRSVSQRSKISALGLEHLDSYVSEEWGEVKPGEKRFSAIMCKHAKAKKFIYVGDNVKKDFVTPNRLGWTSIGVRDNGQNIHSQSISIEPEFMPKIWVNDLQELLKND